MSEPTSTTLICVLFVFAILIAINYEKENQLARQCFVCKKRDVPFVAQLKAHCGDVECRVKLGLYFVEQKKKAEAKKTYRKHLKEKKDFYLKDVRHQHNLTQKVFNKMRRLQELEYFKSVGKEPVCFSCSKPLGGDTWACGHFKTVGSNGLLRYDIRNTHIQHNKSCNMGLSGDIAGTKNTHGYRAGYVIRYGEDLGNELLEFCDTSNEVKKWTGEELESLRSEFNREIKRLV